MDMEYHEIVAFDPPCLCNAENDCSEVQGFAESLQKFTL